MEIKVSFRFNTRTGEVELFEIDQASGLPHQEHERSHDALAAEIGRILTRDPLIREWEPGAAPPERQQPVSEAEPETQPLPLRRKDRENN